MMKKLEKSQVVEDLVKELSSASMVVFTQFEGLTVEADTALRKQCRQASVSYRVIKNTLAARAFDHLQMKGLEQVLKGTTALAVGFDDPIVVAKVIHEFTKGHNELKIKGGWMRDRSLSTTEVIQLAQLPSRQALLGQVVGVMRSPISRLVFILAGILRQMVMVTKAIQEKKEKTGSSQSHP